LKIFPHTSSSFAFSLFIFSFSSISALNPNWLSIAVLVPASDLSNSYVLLVKENKLFFSWY
jgi:hypothetical protein